MVGGCGSNAMSRRDLVINVKLVATRGGDRIHTWPTQQNSCLECGCLPEMHWVRLGPMPADAGTSPIALSKL